MARLVVCPSCSEHVKHGERICPHCDAVLLDERSTVFHAAGAMLIGWSLAGCPAGDDGDSDSNPTVEPDYGVPATESDSATVTASTTMATSSTAGTTASTTDGGTADTGEPEYGVPATEGTGTDGSTGSTTGATTAEPDYGVPDTGG